MELATFNQFLGAAVKNGASDVHFKVASPPAVRINGLLRPIKAPNLAVEDLNRVAGHLLAAARFHGDVNQVHEIDCSYPLEGVGRFRASLFRQKGNFAAVMRAIPMAVPTFESLGLPPVLAQIAKEERGLVLITGVTGSGKTSTLAAIVNHLNHNDRRHIITIEDPIEFLHEDASSRITQREIGPDTASFATALKAALRQDPDVILVGELRDFETIDIALKAAETGHLVLATVHTTDATRTISRLIGVFPSDAETGVRHRLAENLKAIVSQRLLARNGGPGRVLAAEVLINNLSIQEFIQDPDKTAGIKDYLEKASDVTGSQSFDQHLTALYKQGLVTLEVAKEAASNPADFERALSFE